MGPYYRGSSVCVRIQNDLKNGGMMANELQHYGANGVKWGSSSDSRRARSSDSSECYLDKNVPRWKEIAASKRTDSKFPWCSKEY